MAERRSEASAPAPRRIEDVAGGPPDDEHTRASQSALAAPLVVKGRGQAARVDDAALEGSQSVLRPAVRLTGDPLRPPAVGPPEKGAVDVAQRGLPNGRGDAVLPERPCRP